MLKVLGEAVAAVRSLNGAEQKRAAQVLLAWLNGESERDFAIAHHLKSAAA